MTTAVATRELTMSEALNEALREEMRRDDGVFVSVDQGRSCTTAGGPATAT